MCDAEIHKMARQYVLKTTVEIRRRTQQSPAHLNMGVGQHCRTCTGSVESITVGVACGRPLKMLHELASSKFRFLSPYTLQLWTIPCTDAYSGVCACTGLKYVTCAFNPDCG